MSEDKKGVMCGVCFRSYTNAEVADLTKKNKELESLIGEAGFMRYKKHCEEIEALKTDKVGLMRELDRISDLLTEARKERDELLAKRKQSAEVWVDVVLENEQLQKQLKQKDAEIEKLKRSVEHEVEWSGKVQKAYLEKKEALAAVTKRVEKMMLPNAPNYNLALRNVLAILKEMG